MSFPSVPQENNIEYNRVYRRSEFAQRPPKWSSPLPSLEIKGDGSIMIYASNLPRYVNDNIYECPIQNTKADIEDKMTPMTDCNGNILKFKMGIVEMS